MLFEALRYTTLVKIAATRPQVDSEHLIETLKEAVAHTTLGSRLATIWNLSSTFWFEALVVRYPTSAVHTHRNTPFGILGD